MIDIKGTHEVPVTVKVSEYTLFHSVISMIERRYSVNRYWYRKENDGPYWRSSDDSRVDDELVGPINTEQQEAMNTINSMVKICKEITIG